MSEESISQGLDGPARPERRDAGRAPPPAPLQPVDESLAETDVAIDGAVPDWCNLGWTLRIVLAVNLLFFCVAAVGAVSVASWVEEWFRLAMLVEPVLIASLFVCCLARHFAWRLPARVQVAIALAIPPALTIVARTALGDVDPTHGTFVVRDAIFAAMLAGSVLYWARLRERAYSPALAEAQLQALQSRIRPHFLFNSLNAALGLIRSDPRRAETLLEDISDLFRVLMRDSRERVPLASEVELCKQYLAIEKLRLGDRLESTWRMDDGAKQALVPSLLLQPLVENAVHHGIEPSVTAGTIDVAIRRDGRTIDIVISNPWHGEAMAERTRGNGIGLDNVRQRLALVHDLEAGIEGAVRDGRYVVHVRLPAERRRAPRAARGAAPTHPTREARP